jgi:hypothetical protein
MALAEDRGMKAIRLSILRAAHDRTRPVQAKWEEAQRLARIRSKPYQRDELLIN